MTEHYFSPGDPDADRVPLRVELEGAPRDLVTARGVFSEHRLDKATAILLASDPPLPPTGDVLDLGCGWGPIALTMALRSPRSRVWAIDVNPLARALTAENARRVGAENIAVRPPEDVPDDLRLDAIWSNPPIRIGKQPLHDLLRTWLPRLAPGAHSELVVGKNLGADSLQTWISTALAPLTADRVGSSKGFRLLRVTAPPA